MRFMSSRESIANDETLPMQDEDRQQTRTVARKRNFINLRTFVVVSGVLMCAQSALSMYTKSVLTSIERRFQISSSLAGFIVGSFNFGNMLFVVLVSKLSSEGNRPRIMSIGSMVVAFGGFVNVIPHMVNSNYVPSLVKTLSESADSYSSKNVSQDVTDVANSHISCSTSNTYMLLVMGEMLQGIGATVLVPLGSSYVDDFAQHGKSPLYLGIMFLLQNLGPGVGYLIGSLTSSLYVDFDRVEPDDIFVEKTQHSWVGAWWLGYIIISTCVILCAIPLFWFPRTMDKKLLAGRKIIREITSNGDEQKTQKHDDLLPINGTVKKTNASKENKLSKDCLPKTPSTSHCERLLGIFADLCSTVKRLLLNPVYVLIVMGYSSLMFAVGALTAFMPKFLEVVFYQSKSQASLIFALSMPIVICLGLFSGGFIVQRSKLGTKGTMLFIVCVSGATILLYIPSYYIRCDSTNVDSPCVNLTLNVSGNYTICTTKNGELCQSLCYAFVALISLAALVCCHIVTPSYSVILRTVNPKDKCTAIGLKFLIIRLVAFIPSPMITGAVIDDTCTKWSASPACVGTATCLQHDRELFRTSYIHIIFISVIMTFVFNFAGYMVMRRRQERPPQNIDSVI